MEEYMEENKEKSHAEHHHEHREHNHEHEPAGISCGCGHCHEHSHSAENHSHKHEQEMSLPKILAALAIFAVAMIAKNLPVVNQLAESPALNIGTTNLVSAVLILMFLAAYLTVGLPVLKNAVYGIFHGDFLDEQFLMAIASVGAVCLGEYPEAVAVMIFYQIGEYFQDYAVGKSKGSIKELMKLRPDSATVLQNGLEKTVDPEHVKIGEIIVVKPGERIPLDGTIVKGNSFVDTSAQTGESTPREVLEGHEVLAGFINTQGVLQIEVKRSYKESSVSRILELVENATTNKAKSEKFIRKFAKIYTPAVCTAAIVLALVPPFFTGMNFAPWINRALIFLVVSCPCALVISVPLSFFGGIGSCSKQGILVKGSNYIEALSRVKSAVFDKTGTLTKGTFVVTQINPVKEMKLSEEELITLATHAEYYSTHPIAKSFRSAHNCERCGKIELADIKEIAGQGLSVTADNQKILVGNEKLMATFKVLNFAENKNKIGTTAYVAVNGQYAGYIVISDEVKETSAQAIKALKKCGVAETFMLTGDREDVAQKIGEKLGIDKVFANLLPKDKVDCLERIMAETTRSTKHTAPKEKADSHALPAKTVMYVGDGINDAPVLARADIGVAIGALGSDAAIEASDVVIMGNDLTKLADGIKTARKTVAIVQQNIVFALGVKFAIMALGVAGFAGMWLAVFGDVGVTFLAVLNALRLLKSSKN